jgi:hypothetical protein
MKCPNCGAGLKPDMPFAGCECWECIMCAYRFIDMNGELKEFKRQPPERKSPNPHRKSGNIEVKARS